MMECLTRLYKTRAYSNKEHDDLFHAVINIPLEYITEAEDTIEYIYGGTLLRIRIDNHPSNDAEKCAYVTFASHELAVRALSSKSNWPDGQSIIISKEPDPSDACQASHFDVLNADCLFHLYEYLQPMDIANASEAFKCLAQFTENNICQKYTTLDFVAGSNLTRKYTFNELKCVLKHLGGHIKQLNMNAGVFQNPSATHVSAAFLYCPNLIRIELRDFTFGAHAIESLCSVPLPASAARFSGGGGFTPRWSELWPKWSNLRSLAIHGLETPHLCFRWLDTVTNLTTFTISDCFVSNEKPLLHVVRQNQATLTSLSLLGVFDRDGDPQLYNLLYEIAPKLVQLKVHAGCPTRIEHLHQLEHLKHLQLCNDPIIKRNVCVDKPWQAYFQQFNRLESLIVDRPSTNMIEAVGMVPTLRYLAIRYPWCDYHIMDAVSKLTNLRQLRLRFFYHWPNEATIELLRRNHSVEEIIFNFCYYMPSCTQIIEFLTQQAASMDTPRRTVHLIINDSPSERTHVSDHTVLKISWNSALYREPVNESYVPPMYDEFGRVRGTVGRMMEQFGPPIYIRH